MSSEKRNSPGPRFRGITRRLNVRLTLWFTLVFLAGSLLVFALTFVNLFRELRAEEQQSIQSVAFGYYLTFSSALGDPPDIEAGLNAIVAVSQAQGLQAGGSPHFFRLTTASNRTLYLRYPSADWEQDFMLEERLFGDTLHSEGFLALESPMIGYRLEVFAFPLVEGLILQLGYDTANRVRVLQVFQRSFLLTFVLLLGVSAAGGFFFVSRSLRPIGELNTDIRRIIQTADLDRRLKPLNSGDDLDELVGSYNAMLDRLNGFVRTLTDALDAVAHDLRTPMTRFRSIAERALSSDDPAALREALSDTLEESDRILSMLNAMMDISEAESGAMRLNRTTVPLLEICGVAVDVYSIVAETNDMTIDLDVEDDVEVSVDVPRMSQVLGNLLDNAVKYGDDGSQISISGGVAVNEPGMVRITVTSHGPEIDPESLPRIWDRLYRAHREDRRDGIGLGLTLVKAIVAAHGGEVTVVSSDHTTRFSLLLPKGTDNITEV